MCVSVYAFNAVSCSFCHSTYLWFDSFFFLLSKNIIMNPCLVSFLLDFFSSCILHQDYFETFYFGRYAVTKFCFRWEWSERKKNPFEYQKNLNACVSWRVLCMACANKYKRITKWNNHNMCPLPKHITKKISLFSDWIFHFSWGHCQLHNIGLWKRNFPLISF